MPDRRMAKADLGQSFVGDQIDEADRCPFESDVLPLPGETLHQEPGRGSPVFSFRVPPSSGLR
jgi:hypothetical protein